MNNLFQQLQEQLERSRDNLISTKTCFTINIKSQMFYFKDHCSKDVGTAGGSLKLTESLNP